MKYLGFSAVLLLISQLSFGQTKQNVGVFNTVEATDKIQVELIKSAENSVVVEGANREQVEVINKNGNLRLKMNTLKILQGNSISIKVYFTDLNAVSSKKGAKIFSTSGNVISSNLFKVYAAEGALVDLHVKLKQVEVKTTSGATVALYGVAESQTVISNFGGKYEGKSFTTNATNVTVNGGGKAEVNVSNTVEAKTRAGGVIDIFGSPEHRVEKKMAGGIINFK